MEWVEWVVSMRVWVRVDVVLLLWVRGDRPGRGKIRLGGDIHARLNRGERLEISVSIAVERWWSL